MFTGGGTASEPVAGDGRDASKPGDTVPSDTADPNTDGAPDGIGETVDQIEATEPTGPVEPNETNGTGEPSAPGEPAETSKAVEPTKSAETSKSTTPKSTEPKPNILDSFFSALGAAFSPMGDAEETPADGYTNLADGAYMQVNAGGVIEAVSLGDLKKVFIPARAKDTGGEVVEITAINPNVFAGKGLEGVEFSPESKIESIGAGAFSGNENMVVEGGFLPDTLVSIGNEAFMNAGITQITLPETLTSVGSKAFQATKLTSVDIPGSIENLQTQTFMRCASLVSVTLHEGLKTIGNSCFVQCNLGANDGVVTLPSTITASGIGDSAFANNTGLTINAPNYRPGEINIGAGVGLNSSTKYLYFNDTHPDSYWFVNDDTGLIGGIKKKGSVPSATYPIDESGKLTIPKQVGDTVV
ncbi:MAG: leucine-rich repeat protein, partial [Clostridiales Family XIII bacterium]|nr:leucine-rich repeat protein [Clostridiales Family XIII bacterium]